MMSPVPAPAKVRVRVRRPLATAGQPPPIQENIHGVNPSRFQYADSRDDASGDLDLGPAISALRSHRGSRPVWDAALDRTRRSLREFCLRYFPHHFTLGFCELHEDIFTLCDSLGPKPSGVRGARIAPRKFGKTTIISLALPLQKLAFFERNFIILLGESATTAEANLATIANELETNSRLLDDFPHLQAARDSKGQTVKWTDRQLIFKSHQTIIAKGMAARMRGLKFRHSRPDLAILDDPESPETADTFLKRRRHKQWFGGTFMGLGADDWDILAIGNNPHHDCLIADLVRSPEWNGKLWRAENIPVRENERYIIGNTKHDGSALWPEGWSLERLEKFRKEPNVGDLGYAREMMGDPRDEDTKIFSPSNFSYFDFEPESLRSRYVAKATFMDPAGGQQNMEFRRGKRDYASIVTAGRTRDGFIEIFDVRMTRVLPDQQLMMLLDVYAAFGAKLGIEENLYKNMSIFLLMDMARRRSLYPQIKPMDSTSTMNKVARIMSLQPLTQTGTIRFARHLIDTEDGQIYFAQFDEFPGDFDDGPDATEGVVRMLDVGKVYQPGQIISLTSGSYWRKEFA